MSDTNFIDFSAPSVDAAWLNDVNKVVYRLLGAAGVAPTTAAQIVANIGAASAATLASLAIGMGASTVGINDAGGRFNATTVEAALQEVAAYSYGANVGKYGADPTGVAESTAAFDAAMATGLPVIVGVGEFKLINWRPKNDVQVYGSGYEKSILVQGAAGSYAIDCLVDAVVPSINGMVLRGVTLRGYGSKAVGYISGTTLTLSGVTYGAVEIGSAVLGYNGSGLSTESGTTIISGSGLSWQVNTAQTVASPGAQIPIYLVKATVPPIRVAGFGAYAVWKSKFDFVASATYRPLEIQGAVANNVFRCWFNVTSENAVKGMLVNGGTYNNFDLFLTNTYDGISLDFVGLGCKFDRCITDGQIKTAGNHTVMLGAIVEEWPGAVRAGEAAIVSTGFSETFVNPMVILSAAAAARVGYGFDPFDNTVLINPKILAATLANPIRASNSYKFTIIGPGQSTTINKMNTIFTDNGGDTTKTLRRVSFVGDCSQWVTNNRPGGGCAIQYAIPVAAATVEILSNTDAMILEPAGALATLTVQVPLAVDGQRITLTSTQAVTALTVGSIYTGGANVSKWPAALVADTPVSLVYRESNKKWYRC